MFFFSPHELTTLPDWFVDLSSCQVSACYLIEMKLCFALSTAQLLCFVMVQLYKYYGVTSVN